MLTITNLYYLCFISLTPFATAWLNNSFLSRNSAVAYSVVIILVNVTQALMFKEVSQLAARDGIKLSPHDREEKRSADVMLGVSVLYLIVAYLVPHYFLVVIVIGLALRTTVTQLNRLKSKS
jgi:uncharacterized membrane protein